MHNTRTHRFLAAAVMAFLLVATPRPAHAASKEIIELQTQVQQLLDMMQRLQSTLDSRFGVIQHLAEQTADNANQVTATVNALQLKLNTQSEASSGKLDAVSGQMQSLNDSIDELKSRVAKMDKAVQEMQAQVQTLQAPPPPVAAPGADASAPGTPASAAPAANAQNAPAPPLQETFQAGVRDYNAAKCDLAVSEFQDVVHFYPLDDLSGQAEFYLGEIAYKRLSFSDAIKAYNAVLEGFSGSPKAPAAQLHKGFALLQMKDKIKRDAGIHELRLLIQRHPQTPEATQARSKLNGMGVSVTGSGK